VGVASDSRGAGGRSHADQTMNRHESQLTGVQSAAVAEFGRLGSRNQ
jgi:hypothetical protein